MNKKQDILDGEVNNLEIIKKKYLKTFDYYSTSEIKQGLFSQAKSLIEYNVDKNFLVNKEKTCNNFFHKHTYHKNVKNLKKEKYFCEVKLDEIYSNLISLLEKKCLHFKNICYFFLNQTNENFENMKKCSNDSSKLFHLGNNGKLDLMKCRYSTMFSRNIKKFAKPNLHIRKRKHNYSNWFQFFACFFRVFLIESCLFNGYTNASLPSLHPPNQGKIVILVFTFYLPF